MSTHTHLRLLTCSLLVLFTISTLQTFAQRIEVRFDKEFSNDSLMNKSLGAGGSFIMDGWHPNLDVQLNFDYTGHKGDVDYFGISQKFTKYKFGISALYSLPLGERFQLRVGGDVSYNNIKKVVSDHSDENNVGILTTAYRANMLGIGAIAQIQVKLGKIFRIGAGLTPTYLIPLTAKVDRPNIEKQYDKGIFSMQLQIGIEIKLSNNN